MSGREANWFRGALAVAGALSLGAGGVAVGIAVEGGAAGAAVVHHRSPGAGVLTAAHGTRSAKSHGAKSHGAKSHVAKSHVAKSHGAKSPKAHGTKHHGTRAKRKDHRGALPVIGHAKDLSAEPVVHADKHKAPTKLLVKNLVVGTGATATPTSTVKVKYVGADYTNGKDFTATTWQHGQPTSFSLKQVIAGFSQGITGMRVGGRREIVIPPKLGYGNAAQGPIKANETLVFVVDLQGVS